MKLVGARIVLGVSGSIAAYKAVTLLRTLVQEGAEVSVAMTESATRFVSPLTFEVLSRHPVATSVFAAGQEMIHLTLPEHADVIVIAPATANQLAKYATGLADDLLSTMVLTTTGPLILAPAMDGGMWDHPAVQANVCTLRQRGVIVLDPEEGVLASGKVGKGRLTEEGVIIAAIEAALMPHRDCAGQRVLIAAGPTQEAIDPVRFISNRSSGKMGYALAEAARDRGADVILVTGPTDLPIPPGIEPVHVCTAEDMTKAMQSRLSWSTVVIMAAAVADFRPKRPSSKKIKKSGTAWQHLELEPTDDILTLLTQQRSSQLIVGFAAETEAVAEHAADKLKRKGLDLIVGNNVAEAGSGFGSDTSAAVLIDREGRTTPIPVMSKRALADKILDAVTMLRVSGEPAR
ncbi:MAG: bifunctional phosphopantothenoylcysteine decarboxylase/phosphopantothenate--cysteine ligase CoaBC [Nitrospirales bacterium]|nr:bifunctional phosphopantothenoylcysteine decarboxylase/phosphopantothenate--cysteine ligase CoaBC [Nitrospirales bacterium]